ncbi:MAG: hypothetical protein N2C14_26945, partial [Planctomycetales bacterium]
MIRWHCRKCDLILKCDYEYAGKRAKCAGCDLVQIVPSLDKLFDESMAIPGWTKERPPAAKTETVESAE